MKPLLVLLISFIISLFMIRIITGRFDAAFSGRIAMTVMLLFTALGHFLYPKGMSMMIPDFIPYKLFWVYLTAFIEIFAAIGLLIPIMTVKTGWFLIIFLLLILPANIYGAVKNVDYENANYQGKGLNYLWFRIPLQVIYLAWIYLFAIEM
ncbi:DoxX family protein [Robertkochia solimangrovi]|uniref:DoxX family protein n=1 Tax=Robertkochia solimangrovi TaxID=2213046 RepID=UPI00117F2BC4|nr:hypothetical protein [Robertkochia solimangrovi]TRZ42224.1 hypothetical protein DMZ48_14435 [Robertkochia solimangrovi]